MLFLVEQFEVSDTVDEWSFKDFLLLLGNRLG